MLTIGDKFPAFNLQACVSREKGKEFQEINNASYKDKWLVVFFWPMDFTFICPTEIAEFGRKNGDFADRDAQVLGASTDTHFVHLAWRNDHADLKDLPFPMLADTKRELSESLGILHKDLKPANILVETRDSGPFVRLTDFGNASLLDPDRLETLGITRLGMTVDEGANLLSGTPLYMAPELFAGQPPSARSDVFALGVLLYQLLADRIGRPMVSGWEKDIDDALLV